MENKKAESDTKKPTKNEKKLITILIYELFFLIIICLLKNLIFSTKRETRESKWKYDWK